MRFIFITVLSAISASAIGGGGEEESRLQYVYASDGEISLQQKTRTGVLAVNLSLASENCVEAQDTLWWGTETCPAENAIEKIRVRLGQQPIAIPRSAFADLANVSRAILLNRSREVILRIEGGKTSTGYTAELTFEAGKLVKRVVQSRIFPDEVSETITYTRRFSEDM